MSDENKDFGFEVMQVGRIHEYQSSIDINLRQTNMYMESVISDAAVNLAYRAEQLIKQDGWAEDEPVSFVLTLTFARGDKKHKDMSINQTVGSPHQESIAK
jgi:hypothetical protein